MTQLYKIVYHCENCSTLQRIEEYDLDYPVFDYRGKYEAHKWIQEQAKAKMKELCASGDVHPGGELEWFDHNGTHYVWSIKYIEHRTGNSTIVNENPIPKQRKNKGIDKNNCRTVIDRGFEELGMVEGTNSAGVHYSIILADMQAAWNKLKETL